MNKKQWYKTICWLGKTETIPCTNHSYSWSGNMPCTGVLRCIFCGKPKDLDNKNK
jgi:hypothetical protein